LDFGKPESSKTINDWVFGNTAGKMPNAVPEQIPPGTVSYIINTAYFNGVWKYSFDAKKTETRDFYRQDGTKSPVQSMGMERKNFLYLDNELFQAVKLPYGPDQKYSMVVILPKDLGVNSLLGKFDTSSWQSWLNGFEEKNGILYLPKFKLEYGRSVTDALKSAGLVLPFDYIKADFSKLSTDGNSGFYLNNVVHKTYMDVNGEGTEAASSTAIDVVTTNKEAPISLGKKQPES